jgi:hypothetical protein
LTFIVIAWTSWTARVQGLAFAPFVGVLWLLAADSRHPSRRVYWALPLLVLWANIHGTAFLGAGLLALRGALVLVQREGAVRDRLLKAAVLISSPLLLLASPYGFQLIGYYHSLLLNPAFARYVTEWWPTTFGLATAPFFLAALLAAWLAGRCPARLTRFDQGALLLMFVLALRANRSVVWFMLAALVLLPKALDGVLASGWDRSRYRRVNMLMAGAAPIVCAVAVAVSFAQPSRSFTGAFPPAAADRVAQIAAREPHARIFANERFADWLVFEHPELAGRIAFDGRFELLKTRELKRIVDFRALIGSASVVRGYRILVLYPSRLSDGKALSALLETRARHVAYRDRNIAVITQDSSSRRGL